MIGRGLRRSVYSVYSVYSVDQEGQSRGGLTRIAMTANGNPPLVTIVGRPNVGKSTLFNRLLARRRAITASMPGVTRDIVEEEFVLAGMPLRLLDTGGVGDDAGEFGAVVAERALAAADDAVAIMLVVAVQGITPEDERLADRLRAASDRVVVVVNKVESPGAGSGDVGFLPARL